MLTLRKYQEELKQSIYDQWDNDIQNVMAVMPTGMGKTKTFSSIAIDKAVIPHDKMPTAIMVHRKELVQQISLTLAEEKIVHNIIAPRPTVLGIIAAQRRVLNQQFYNYTAPISVVSVDTLNARIEQHKKWAQSIRLWITDEAAHLLRKNKWGKAVEYFPNAIGLGVTATPERLDKRGLSRETDGVFDTMVEGPSVRWGIDNGFLSKYKVAIPKSDFERFLKTASGNSDFTYEAMTQASQQSQIVGDVVQNYLKFANGKQAILFATDVGTAYEMERKFLAAGVPAKTLTGMSSDQERLNGMLDFRDKKIKVLINVDLFDEGLDVPGIECVIMARPTMSLAKFRQMVGRGLRPAHGKDYLILIDHVGNVERHGLPCKNVQWSLGRPVKRQFKKNLLRICSNPECNSPYERIMLACPYCGTQAVKGKSGGGGGRIPPEQVDGDLELMDPETLREMYAATNLEDPSEVERRVSHVAGGIAGKSAFKNQLERIAMQQELVKKIAHWAGYQREACYLSDREIHKKFYLYNNMTIQEALSKPRAEMQDLMEGLSYE